MQGQRLKYVSLECNTASQAIGAIDKQTVQTLAIIVRPRYVVVVVARRGARPRRCAFVCECLNYLGRYVEDRDWEVRK